MLFISHICYLFYIIWFGAQMSVFGLVRKCRGFIWCANVGFRFGAQISGFRLLRECRVSVWCANVGFRFGAQMSGFGLVRKCRVRKCRATRQKYYIVYICYALLNN